MDDDQHFVRLLSQTINEQVTAIQSLGVAYSSNRVYLVETDAGQRYVVKQPKQIREQLSPFWQHMDAIFGINSAMQITALPSVAKRLRQQTIIPAPEVLYLETDHILLDAPYGIVTYLDGTAHEPDTFPDSAAIHYQLGQYMGYLHTRHYPGYGNVLMDSLQSKADFGAAVVSNMRRTIQNFWRNQPELHAYLDKLVDTTNPDAIFSTASLIMIDIAANQFVYQDNRISGVVDLDAYVIGPREWELSMLEMCITQPAAFQRGYECYATLPAFAPFRAFYRLWSYLNEPDQGYDVERFVRFMQQAVYFA